MRGATTTMSETIWNAPQITEVVNYLDLHMENVVVVEKMPKLSVC